LAAKVANERAVHFQLFWLSGISYLSARNELPLFMANAVLLKQRKLFGAVKAKRK